MNKTGPTPKPNATQHSVNQRQSGATLLDVAIALPDPSDGWLDSTRRAATTYAESVAARAIRAEDVMELTTMFELIDKRSRYILELTGTAEADEGVMRTIKIADTIIARIANNLGIGPWARTRLGIAELEQRGKEQAETAKRAAGTDF